MCRMFWLSRADARFTDSCAGCSGSASHSVLHAQKLPFSSGPFRIMPKNPQSPSCYRSALSRFSKRKWGTCHVDCRSTGRPTAASETEPKGFSKSYVCCSYIELVSIQEILSSEAAAVVIFTDLLPPTPVTLKLPTAWHLQRCY